MTLTNSGSVSYPVTVTPLNGFNGSVALAVTGGLPTCTGGPTNCVSYSFTPSQVPQNGDWTSTLTLWTTSSNVPGGSFPIGVTGSATGYSPQTAGFTLSTLVTTVTAAPTPILNNGQPTSLSVTYSPTSPAISSCSVPLPDGSSNPYVSCQVSNSTAGSATLLIKATTAAHNGTYVVYGNGNAMSIHAAVFDAQPQGYGSGNSIPAGQTIEITASCLCPDPDDGEYAAAGGPDVEVSGPGGQQGWVYLDTWSATEMLLEASPPPGTQPGTYAVTVDWCDGFLPFDADYQCEADGGDVTVEEAEEQIQSVTPAILMVGATSQTVTINGTGLYNVSRVNLPSGVAIQNQSPPDPFVIVLTVNVSLGTTIGPGQISVDNSNSLEFDIDGPYNMLVSNDTIGTCNGCSTTVQRNVTYQVLNYSGSLPGAIPMCENVLLSNWSCNQSQDTPTTTTCGKTSGTTSANSTFTDSWTLGGDGFTPVGCGNNVSDTWSWVASSQSKIFQPVGVLSGYTHTNAVSINNTVLPNPNGSSFVGIKVGH